MTELLCHLLGDYCLQNHAMAAKKTSSWRWAALHVVLYSLPFVLVFRPSHAALAVLAGTHLVIDRFRLAKYWVAFWGVGCEGWLPRQFRLWRRGRHIAWCLRVQLRDFRCCVPEVAQQAAIQLHPEPQPAPDFLAVWLLILVDNTAHLTINHLALRFL